ncbi:MULTISPECIES: hypothetical protein [unclassified Clostridioides]|uniref:hypothetical protein n=2 Tax=unclassified Clostridioides TaxID=2635829 RepID=UPI001D12A8BC|nr:hypothetical protein [Clostridioides sp. ES-S-0145-01]MCC0681927.1 hypothetical protein [Clostridioides sp. ES-S-0005-03]MCC0709323.1 hypothetical protein [Clostridioides sp. ES-S-0190-01]UDN64120.1 hypothetical protein IC758_19810 [Clostridioides sp. ES-W-0016-02]
MFYIRLFLLKIANNTLKKPLNLYMGLNIFLFILLYIFKGLGSYLTMQPILIIIVLSTKRITPLTIFFAPTKHLSMNLLDLDIFKNLNYDISSDKDKIADFIKLDFKKSLLELNRRKVKVIRFNTHKWVINNTLKEMNELLDNYKINIKFIGKCYIRDDILLIAGKNTNSCDILRKKYKVILIRKDSNT